MLLEKNANFMEYVSNFEFAWVKERKPYSNLNSNHVNGSLWSVQVWRRQKHITQETSYIRTQGVSFRNNQIMNWSTRTNSSVWPVPYACAHPTRVSKTLYCRGECKALLQVSFSALFGCFIQLLRGVICKRKDMETRLRCKSRKALEQEKTKRLQRLSVPIVQSMPDR